MKVKAIQKGYYDDQIRNVGEEFDVPDGFSCKWAVPTEDFKPEVIKSAERLAKDAEEGAHGKRKEKKEPAEVIAKKRAKKKKSAQKKLAKKD